MKKNVLTFAALVIAILSINVEPSIAQERTQKYDVAAFLYPA